MTLDLPWRDPASLARLLGDWSARLAGRRVHGVAGGTGWLALLLAGGEPPAWLFLSALPGATLLYDDAALPPPEYLAVLGRAARHPLAAHLGGAAFLGAAAAPSDRIALLSFVSRAGAHAVLAHQLFGSRGHALLAGADGRLLWSLHAGPPEALLAAAAAAAATATATTAAATPPMTPSAPATTAPAALAGAVATASAVPRAAAPDDGVAARFRAAALARLGAHLEVALAAQGERAVRQAAAATARLRENLARDLAAADRGDELRRQAEALAARLGRVTRGASVVTLPDPAGGGEITLALDPSRSPAANLEDLFRRARKAERGRAVVAGRLAEAERRLAAVAAAHAELLELPAGLPADAPPAERLATLLAWRRRHAALLDLPAGGVPAPARARAEAAPERPFRRYRIDGRWEAWVGRSAAENDELTHRAAAPDDIWLHAQGVTGSHVVLRAGGKPGQVPRGVLEKAAALAALHSRARDSELVPVVWTLRKYVRKPRRSPPGTAAYSREKSMLVPPLTPAGVEPD